MQFSVSKVYRRKAYQRYLIEEFILFEISQHAVKNQSKIFKSVLKLDKNFHIYSHGDRKLDEGGTENDGRKYYKG